MEMKKQTIAPEFSPKNRALFMTLAKTAIVLVNVLMIAVYLLGFCTVDGKTIGVLTITDDLFKIFSLNKAMWYYYLAGCAYSVVFIVFGFKSVFQIKSLVYTLKGDNLYSVGAQQGISEVLRNSLMFFIIGGMLRPLQLTTLGMIAIGAYAVILIAVKVALEYCKDERIRLVYLLKTAGYALIEFAILFLLLIFIVRPVIENAISGLGVLFSYITFSDSAAIYTLYKALLREVAFIVLISMYISLMTSVLYDYETQKAYERERFMRATLIVLAIDLIVYIGFVAKSEVNEDYMLSYFYIVKQNFLLYAALGLAWHFVSYFPLIGKYKKISADGTGNKLESKQAATNTVVAKVVEVEVPEEEPQVAPQEEAAEAPQAEPQVVPQEEPIEEVIEEPVVEDDGDHLREAVGDEVGGFISGDTKNE